MTIGRRIIIYLITALSAVIVSIQSLHAQEKIGDSIEIDKTVHNFGEIMLGSGPVSCTFTITNTGDSPIVIYNVTKTCGCTAVDWTREPIRPGQSGTITATYSNDEGPYPFDKSLTVYFSGVKKPAILKLRGVSLAEKKPLKELYPVSYGAFAVKEEISKCGNLEQGEQKSGAVMVANISSKPIEVEFKDISKNLKIAVEPNPIPAESTAEMLFTVTSDREIWGKNTYYATPVVNGRVNKNSKGHETVGVWAFTKENFSNLTQEEKMQGAHPQFDENTCSFGIIPKGQTIHAEFTFKNIGKEPFKVYKVNSDACCWSHSAIPYAAPGEEVTFRIHIETQDMPKGESLTIVTLTTNSPLRPLVNLFIAGYIE